MYTHSLSLRLNDQWELNRNGHHPLVRLARVRYELMITLLEEKNEYIIIRKKSNTAAMHNFIFIIDWTFV